MLVVVAALLSLAQTGLAGTDTTAEKKKYIASIVSLLRIHAQTIRQLSANEFKYTENLVRHANAIKRIFGLLGPMDWHTAKSITLSKRINSEEQMDDEMFEQLAKNSSRTLKILHSAAVQAIQEGDKNVVVEALENLQKSCEGCHAFLPPGTAPDVWNTKVAPGN